jgi:hypothetical protein
MQVSATDADSDRTGDSATNTASRSVTVSDDDAAQPLISLNGSLGAENDGQNQNFTWSVSDASGLSSYSVTITRNGATLFSGNADGSFDFNSYGVGTYELSVSATDAGPPNDNLGQR